MSDLISAVGLRSSPPASSSRQQPTQIRARIPAGAGGNENSTEGPLAMTRQEVAQALTAAGFLGVNVARCEAIRRFAQSTARGSPSDMDENIQYVREALGKDGFCSPTISGTEKMEVFVEPKNLHAVEPAAAIDPVAAAEIAAQITAQAASQIQEQAQTAQWAQAHIPPDAAVKLLA